jgi:two-component system, chemotaxis family, protein-glutamate methylesterase/glutaminase
MQALPSTLSSDDQITGISCPECFGVLNARVGGAHASLRFRCRTGHLYSLEEVIVGKEGLIEEHLWAAMTALDELGTLLRETIAHGKAPDADAFARRAEEASRTQEELRGLLQGNAPTVLGAGPVARDPD